MTRSHPLGTMRNFARAPIVALALSSAIAGAPLLAEDLPSLLWRIGEPDDDTSDLALGPRGYGQFLEAFRADPIYVVGSSKARDAWPYAHPGPDDGWAGGKPHTFEVLFALEGKAQGGPARLWIDLVDSHYRAPPVLRVELNGRAATVATAKGAGDGSITGDPSKGRESRLAVKLPAGALRPGLNRLRITNARGSWLLYDWLGLEAPAGVKLAEARGAWLRSVRVDPWLTRRGDRGGQIVRASVFRIGAKGAEALSAPGIDPVPLPPGAGPHEVELFFPAVERETTTTVVLRSGDHVLGKKTIRRRPVREREPVDWVDGLVGTSTSRWMLFPGSSRPFGFVKLSPDNQDQGWKAGYEYLIDNIAGFSHIHSWTMAGLLTMPTTGPLETTPGPQGEPDKGYRSPIRHETEISSPGYYAVTLDDSGIRAELTSTVRCGFQRYTFPESKESRILFDLLFPTEYGFTVHEAEVRRVSDREIEGWSRQQAGRYAKWNEYTVHFVARLSKPLEHFGGWVGSEVRRGVEKIEGKGDVGAFVEFSTAGGEAVKLQTGISLVSVEQARLNLEEELGPFGGDFEAARRDARREWNEILGRIEIEGGRPEDHLKFYTNLYRSYCARTILSDANGKYVDMCEKVRQLPDPKSPVYGCDAFWNTFWNLNQLWTLVNPRIASRWSKSLLEIYDRGGWLAKGPTGIEYSSIMVASHEIPLIVSTWQKGIRDFDGEKAYRAMRKCQTVPGRPHECGGHVGNRQLASYMKLGYVPKEKGPVSNTLEYAYDDWCVAQMALALGKKEDAKEFLRRAASYRNVFDPSVGYMRERHADGRWVEGFDPFSGRGFVEGNSFQYTWFAPHDVEGLIRLLGKEEFNRRLDKALADSEPNNFNATGDRMAQFPINHGNQPNMQSAWLFNFSGKPWLAQKWARSILDHYYGSGPVDGWPGDEDQGQMGAWFAMSAMGLFEMNGGAAVRPTYEIGSPLFDRVTIHLDGDYYPGGTFVIVARNNSPRNLYIQSATLDGKPLDRPWIHHSDVVDGGELVLDMGPEPNRAWGSAPEKAPPSMTRPAR